MYYKSCILDYVSTFAPKRAQYDKGVQASKSAWRVLLNYMSWQFVIYKLNFGKTRVRVHTRTKNEVPHLPSSEMQPRYDHTPIRSNCSKNTRRLNLVKTSFLHFLHSTKFSRQRLNFPTKFTFRLNLLGRLNVDLVGRVFFLIANCNVDIANCNVDIANCNVDIAKCIVNIANCNVDIANCNVFIANCNVDILWEKNEHCKRQHFE